MFLLMHSYQQEQASLKRQIRSGPTPSRRTEIRDIVASFLGNSSVTIFSPHTKESSPRAQRAT